VVLNAGASLTNIVTATGKDDENHSASDTDDATVTGIDVAPSIHVVKTADPTTINEGGQSVTYTYAVTNTSSSSTDAELTLTALVDDRGTVATGDDINLLAGFVSGSSHGTSYTGGDTDNDYKVDAGETWSFAYTTNVVLNAGASLTNIVTATGKDDENHSASDTDDATVTGSDVAPAIHVVKTADPTTINEGGQSVTYTYAVTNTSSSSTDAELTLTALVDDRGTVPTGDDINLLAGFVAGSSHGTSYTGGDTDNDYKVDAGETWNFAYTTNVVLNAGASLTNI